jgi:hypothetical protein
MSSQTSMPLVYAYGFKSAPGFYAFKAFLRITLVIAFKNLRQTLLVLTNLSIRLYFANNSLTQTLIRFPPTAKFIFSIQSKCRRRNLNFIQRQ